MPDLKRTIDIIFNGLDKTSAGTNSALKNINKVTSTIQGAAAPVAGATKQVLKFEAAMIAGAVAITAFSVKVAGDFDTAFREIATLIDLPLDGLEDFRNDIIEYSKNSTQSLDEITQSIYSAISAGTDFKDSIQIVSQAEKLAVASKASLSDTLVVLVSSLNAYAEGSDKAEQFSDALFTTVKQGQTTLPELSASLAQVTGIAASAQVPFDELLAAIAALTATGQPTAQAIASIKGAISAIIKPSGEAEKLAKNLGIEFNVQALEAKGLSGVLKDVQKATGGNTAQMAKLFGRVEALNGALVLTGKGAQKFQDSLDAMAKKTGAVNIAFDKMADAAGNSTQRIINNFKSLLISIGAPLLDEFGGIAKALAAIFGVLDDSIKGGKLKGFVGAIEDIGKELEGVLEDIARNLPAALESADYSEFEQGLETVKKTINDLFSGADISSVSGLKSIIEGVGSAFKTLAEFTQGVEQALEPVIRLLIDAVKWFNSLDDESKELVGTVGGIAIAFDSLAPSIIAVSAAIIALNGNLKGILKFLGKGGLAGAVGLATYELGRWADLNDRLVPGVDTLGTKLFDLFNDGYDPNAIDETTIAQAKLNKEFREARKEAEELTNRLNAISSPLRNVKKETDSAADATNDLGITIKEFDAAYEKHGDNFDVVSGKIVGGSKLIHTETKKIANEVFDASGKLVGYSDGLTNISTKFSAVAKTTKEAKKESDEFLTKMEQIASNERIKQFEIVVDFKTAQLEADTKKFQTIFDSINTTIGSTEKVISTAIGSLSSFIGVSLSDTSFKLIQKQLEIENKARADAFELQKKLTLAEINKIEQQTEALKNGDGIINIKSHGLEQHIEAFMFEILKKIQVRGNAEFVEFLQGIN